MTKAKTKSKMTSSIGAQLLEQVTTAGLPAAPAVAVKSAKQYIRELLSAAGAELSLAELCAQSHKTPVNVATMLSDLRSVKYAGKAGVFLTKSCKRDGVTYYSKA